ncbi:MAG: glycosyltransferase family 39 protein [Dehalococcoidia bacterium]
MTVLLADPPLDAGARALFGRYWALVALIGIVALGAAVRLYDIVGNPPGFFTDEASAGYNAYKILHTGQDEHGKTLPLLFRAFGEYKLPVFIYSQVPVIAILGLSELAVRLTSALYGAATIVTTYLLASALFKRREVAVAAAFFLAIMPWHIHYSRTGFGELVTFPFFLTLGLYLFLEGRRRNALWIAAGVVLGLTLYTYRAAWVTLPPLLVLLAVLYRRELLAGRRYALIGLAIVALMALPIVFHVLLEDDRAQDVSLFNAGLGFWGTLERLATNYRSYFTMSFLFQDGDHYRVTRHYLPGFGELYYAQLPLAFAGLLGLLWRPDREKLIVLALLVLYPLGGAITRESPFSSRTIIGSVVFALLSGYGLIVAADLARAGLRWAPRPAPAIAAGALVAVALGFSLNGFASYLDRYHGEYPKLAADYWGWQYGPKQVVARFLGVEGQYDDLIMDRRFNAPRMFFGFYAPDDCAKCEVGNTDDYDPTRRQLFALRPEDMPDTFTYQTLDVIDYPSGEPAFYLVEITGLASDPPSGELQSSQAQSHE